MNELEAAAADYREKTAAVTEGRDKVYAAQMAVHEARVLLRASEEAADAAHERLINAAALGATV